MRWQEAVERDDIEALKQSLTAQQQPGKGAMNSSAPDPLAPLLFAAREGYTAAVEALLKADVKVDQADSGGVTALIFAAREGHTATVQALLQAGAKVDQADSDGWTALMIAAKKGHTATVQALLHADANRQLKTANGATALSRAIRQNHQEVIDLLRRQVADTKKKQQWILFELVRLTCRVASLLAVGASRNRNSCAPRH